MLSLAFCTQPAEKSEAGEDAEAEELVDAPGETSFTHAQMQTVGIELGAIENKALSNSVMVNGIPFTDHQQLFILGRGCGGRNTTRWGTHRLLGVEIRINEVKVIRCFTPDELGVLRSLAHPRHL